MIWLGSVSTMEKSMRREKSWKKMALTFFCTESTLSTLWFSPDLTFYYWISMNQDWFTLTLGSGKLLLNFSTDYQIVNVERRVSGVEREPDTNKWGTKSNFITVLDLLSRQLRPSDSDISHLVKHFRGEQLNKTALLNWNFLEKKCNKHSVHSYIFLLNSTGLCQQFASLNFFLS